MLIVDYVMGLPAPLREGALRTAVLEPHPDCAKASIAAGKILLKASPPMEPEAQRYFRHALELNGDDSEALYQVGLNHMKQDQPDEARALLTRSFERGYRQPGVYLRLAELDGRRGDVAGARAWLKLGLARYDGTSAAPRLRGALEALSEPDN